MEDSWANSGDCLEVKNQNGKYVWDETHKGLECLS